MFVIGTIVSLDSPFFHLEFVNFSIVTINHTLKLSNVQVNDDEYVACHTL